MFNYFRELTTPGTTKKFPNLAYMSNASGPTVTNLPLTKNCFQFFFITVLHKRRVTHGTSKITHTYS